MLTWIYSNFPSKNVLLPKYKLGRFWKVLKNGRGVWDLKRLPKFRKLSLPKQFSHEQRNTVGPLIWKKIPETNSKFTPDKRVVGRRFGVLLELGRFAEVNSLLVSGRPIDRCISSQSEGWKPRHDVMGFPRKEVQLEKTLPIGSIGNHVHGL